MLSKTKINKLIFIIIAVLVIAGIGLFATIKVVPQEDVGVLLEKNKVICLLPGAHFIKPFAKVTLVAMNERVSVINNVATNNGIANNVSVLWQVVDATQFWQATAGDTNKINALFRTALIAATPSYNITQNPSLVAAGIKVNQALLTGQTLADAQLQQTYKNMQNLATSIAQGIIVEGKKQAQSIRAQGDQELITIEGKAASAAATIIGQGQAQAMQITAPLYHQNPELFKLLVDTKVKMLQQ